MKHEIFDLRKFKHKVNEMLRKVQFQMHFQCQSLFHGGIQQLHHLIQFLTWTSSRMETRLLYDGGSTDFLVPASRGVMALSFPQE